LHWSETPAAHRAIAHHIIPSLNEWSFVWYMVRTYFLGVFVREFRSDSLRLRRQQWAAAAPSSPPQKGVSRYAVEVSSNLRPRVSPRLLCRAWIAGVMYLAAAGKYLRLTRRPS